MAETYEPLLVTVDFDQDVLKWLEDNKRLVNHESLTLIEFMLYEDITTKQTSVRLLNNSDSGKLNLTVHPDEISITLETIMKWALEVEEYEMCERIKYLTKVIEERENNKSKDQKNNTND